MVCKDRWQVIAAMVMIAFFGLTLPVLAKTTRITFDNGMEVIFKENHSSPMITSMVFVQAGAKYETDFNNGTTHLLEHLLFDGTKNRSREEISNGIENHGGYINAFTRKDLTGYLVLMPKEHFKYGIEVQADMLFNSIFPEDELAKERKVVIEEIQMNNDDPSTLAEYFFNATSMAGTPYSRPVLGYKNIIASIPRQRIIDYWNSYYAPNNMIALVIGDFDTDKMVETFHSVFGVVPPVNLPSPPVVSYYAPDSQSVVYKAGNTKVTYLKIGIDAPHFTDPDYYAVDVMADYLNSSENSPFKSVLVDTTGAPLYQSFSLGLETAEEFSRIVMTFELDTIATVEPILEGLEMVLSDFAAYKPSAEIVNGIRVSKKTNEIYLQEKLHYYGIIVAPMLVTTGWDFMESYLDAIEQVNSSMIVRAAERWFTDLKYVATVYHPNHRQEAVEEEETHTVYLREVLPNGLTVVVKSNADSRVFALNVIGKHRSVAEPPMKTGITDFVNRMIPKGTTSLNAEELSQKLASIGAKVTEGDLPWLPHDDFYTTRQFAFMKFETIDEFTDQGLALFADMIKNPSFDSTEIENVRGFLMGVLGRQSGSPRDVARDLFYKTMFPDHPYGTTINGSHMSVGMISRDDLIEHHRKFYSPRNMIITVGTNVAADSMMAMLTEAFGDMPAVETGFRAPEAGAPIVGKKRAHEGMDKEQVYIYLGGKLPGVQHEDAAAIKLAAAVLSDRLGKILREERGLAYSVGSGATMDRNFGWYVCAMGTGASNYEEATGGIIEIIEGLQADGPTIEEIEIAKNSLWGSSLTRRLSRINQAYYMGVGEYLGVGYEYYDHYIEALDAVTIADVHRAFKTYFDTDNYVLSTAGNLDSSQIQSSTD